jgi:NADH:ubiquinone oxidoreductase subunit 6 (subunit J)
MLSSTGERHPVALAQRSAVGAILAYALGGWIIYAAWDQAFGEVPPPPEEGVAALGQAFLNEQLYPFELMGLILLAAVVAALAIVRGERQ